MADPSRAPSGQTPPAGFTSYLPPAGPPPGQQYLPPTGPPPAGQQYPPPTGPPPPGSYYAPPAGPPPGQYYAPPSGPPPPVQDGLPAGEPPSYQHAPPSGPPPGQYFTPPSGPPLQEPVPPTGAGYAPVPAPGLWTGPSDPAYQPSYPQAPFAGNTPAHPSIPGAGGYPTDQKYQYMGISIPNPFVTLPHTTWDATSDFEVLSKTSDDKKIITIMTIRNPEEIQAIANMFASKKGKNLTEVLKGKSTGYFEVVLTALSLGPLYYDVDLVRNAVAGAGTNEACLNEVLLGRSKEDLKLLAAAYQHKHGKPLIDAVCDDLSGKTKRMFFIALQDARPTDATPVDKSWVDRQVGLLYDAAQGKKGADEIPFCEIILNASRPQLEAIIEAYGHKYKSLSKIIKKEFSGHMRDALLHVVNGSKPKRKHHGTGVWRDAKLLEASMAGLGTKDAQLVWRTVRASWDSKHREAVKAAFKERYRKSLQSRIEGETSGAYKKVLSELIGA